MAESVYKVIELVGSSPESWEKAAAAAIERAGKTLRDLRVAKIETLFPSCPRRSYRQIRSWKKAAQRHASSQRRSAHA